MPEKDHHSSLPYDTEYFSEGCFRNGIDPEQFSRQLSSGWLFAVLRSTKIEEKIRLREEAEQSLPLDTALRVEDPRLKPEFWGTQPKVYQAPEGFAFEMTVKPGKKFDYWGNVRRVDENEDGELVLVGEFLDIDMRDYTKKPQTWITVRDRAKKHAVPIMHDGNPDEGGTIRLPSRLDPDKYGAYVTFARQEGWEIVEEKSSRLSARHGKAKVRLLPFEREIENEVYVADFGRYNNFRLDEFMFSDEQITYPPEFSYVPSKDGWKVVYRPINTLILPPIPRDDWTPLWNDHDIMIRNNPTIHSFGDSRFQHIYFGGRQSEREFRVRQFNSYAKNGKFIMRALAIHGVGTKTPMRDVLKVALSKELLDPEDERFG